MGAGLLSATLTKASHLWKVTLGKPAPGTVMNPEDDNPVLVGFNAKDDPVREVDQVANFQGERFLLRNHRTALR